MIKKSLELRVRAISQNGRETNFVLNRQVDNTLSENEILYMFIGQVFKFTHHDSGRSKEVYKVVEILSYEFVNKDLYISPLLQKKSEVFGFFQTENLDGKGYHNPQSNSNIKFFPKTDEGIFFLKKIILLLMATMSLMLVKEYFLYLKITGNFITNLLMVKNILISKNI